MGLVGQFDDLVDGWFEPLRNSPTATRLFYAASEAGNFSMIWHASALAQFALGRTGRREWLAIAAALGAESLVVNQGIKRLFRRERPAHNGERPHTLRQPTTSSFPSGHASAACCAAILLSERQPELTALWWSLAAVVSVSRIHVRIHHASDVLGGSAAGVAIGLAARALI
jgi:membrane-associated phospholipid phosphatase